MGPFRPPFYRMFHSIFLPDFKFHFTLWDPSAVTDVLLRVLVIPFNPG